MSLYQFDNTYDYHAIKIEHPLLNYYGITALTTGQLIDWWNQKNYRDEYVNRTFVRQDPFDGRGYSEIDTLSRLLCIDTPTEDENDSYTFSAWRKLGYNGKNVKFWAPDLENGLGGLYEPWAYYEFDDIKYPYSDLEFGGSSCGGDSQCLITNNEGIYIDKDPQDPNKTISIQHFPNWFAQIIKSHECFMRTYGSIGADTTNWPDCLKARKILSEDIMMNGGISWGGIIGYQIIIDNISCIRYDAAKFTLQLFDSVGIKSNYDNTAAFRNLVLARAATDIAGRASRPNSLINGEYQEPLTNDIKDYTPGEVSLTWNPVEKKYESGTIQVPAVLGTDISAANDYGYDYLEDVDVAEMLDDPFSDNYITMPTGIAIPLLNLNGNPTTIGPHYDAPAGCGDNKKLKLIVRNPWRRTWKKNDRVMLQKINGVWIPLDPGEAPEEQTNQVLGKWDFAYFMTNAEHYFTNWYPSCADRCPATIGDTTNIFLTNGRFTYTQYENTFRYCCYKTDLLSSGEIWQKNIDDSIPYSVLPATNGYWQITSFDFMGSGCGGTRVGGLDGNALAATVIGYDVFDNDALSEANNPYYPYSDPEGTNPFFGCVFPDGYNENIVKVKYDLFKQDLDVTISGGPLYTTNSELKTKTIFEDKNRNIEGYYKSVNNPQATGGIFAGINSGIYNLRHLPADIALNSTPYVSFNNQNGSPLSKYDDTTFFNIMTAGFNLDRLTLNSSSEYKLNNVNTESYFGQDRYSFFYLEDDIKNPVWNLKPNNIARIQFRPMKAELYASLDWRSVYLPEYSRRLLAESPAYTLGCTPQQVLNGDCSTTYSEYDERLKTIYPNDKFVGGGWKGGLNASRGKFGVRAGLMVDDFWKDTFTQSGVTYVDVSENSLYNIYKDGGLLNSTYGSPLWGNSNAVETRNRKLSFIFPDIPNNEGQSLKNRFGYAKPINENNEANFQTDALILLNEWRTWNQLEVYRQLISVDENKYCVGPHPLVAADQLGGGLNNEFLLQGSEEYKYAKAIYLGLAMGYYDLYHRIKTTELAFADDPFNFNNTLLNGYGNNCGLGAVGVIGAICTVKSKAPEGIKFSAQCRYGLPTQTINGELRATFRDIDGINGLYAFNATALYARIFHSWPRELTVYDPRFFAVHHFNPGAGIRNKDIELNYYNNGVLLKDPTDEQKTKAEKQEYPFNFTVTKTESSVDVTEPTSKNGAFVGVNTKTWSDSDLRKRRHWNMPETELMSFSDGRNRRGQLLPYSYEKKCICIAKTEGLSINLVAIDASKKAGEVLVGDVNGGIFVVNAGKNYKVGDRLSTTGGSGKNVVFTVSTVNDSGAILGLIVTQKGEDFEHTDFMNTELQLNSNAKSKVRVVNFEVQGEGFVGYVMTGIISRVDGYDAKPIEVTTPVKLTNPTNGLNGIVDETVEKTVAIPTELRKTDGIYDVFFHYHNDASHVMGYRWNSIAMHDQFITLEIK